jgi:hypothetical protein
MLAQGYLDEWICYRCRQACAKRLTVNPGCSVSSTEPAAYGLICIQGEGTIGPHPLSAPALIRYGALTDDEYFVSAAAAAAGVTITNLSRSEPLVILKHFAEHPALP